MKSLFFTFNMIAVSAFGMDVEPQREKLFTPPSEIINSFVHDFPNKNAVWANDFDEDFDTIETYQAITKVDQRKTLIVYDKLGHLLKVEMPIDFFELPLLTIDYLEENYENSTAQAFTKIEFPSNETIYEVSLKVSNVLFDLTFPQEGVFKNRFVKC